MSSTEKGIEVPHIGFGTYIGMEEEFRYLEVEERKETIIRGILIALKFGYRIIDADTNYHNYEWVGEAIRKSDIPRKDIFLICKGDGSIRDINKTIIDLFNCDKSEIGKGDNYIDLYLIHHPSPDKKIIFKNWDVLSNVSNNIVKRIGLSNVYINRLNSLKNLSDNNSDIMMPFAIEIECHILCQEKETVDWCDQNDVLVIAQSPLGYANIGALIDIPSVQEIANKHHVTPVQILLTYTISRGIIPIPASRSAKHIRENFKSLNIKLDAEDINALSELDQNNPLTTNAQSYKDIDTRYS